MKFVIAALLGLVSSQITECTKDGKCADAKHCCANLTGGDPTGAKAFVDAAKDAAKEKVVNDFFDKTVEGNSGGKGGLCFVGAAGDSGKYTVAGDTPDGTDPDMNGAVLEWTCRGAAPKPKGGSKEPEPKKEVKKEEKKDEKKKDGDAKEGERGTNKEGEGCNHKEKGKGCVEKMCCAKASSVDFSGIKDADMKKQMETAYEASKAKAEEKGDGTCLPDDKTKIK